MLTIHINSFDNDAFQEDLQGEIRNIVRSALQKIKDVELGGCVVATLRDSNGNIVGHVEIDSRDQLEIDEE